MSDQSVPWYLVRDTEMDVMSDEELASHIQHWSQNLRRYREESRKGGHDRGRGMSGPGHAAWWSGKILDRGVRERERRRYRATWGAVPDE